MTGSLNFTTNVNLEQLLRPHLDKRVKIQKHLDIAHKYFNEGKSTTQIGHEYLMSDSRVSDMLEFYKTRIAPLIPQVLNGGKK